MKKTFGIAAVLSVLLAAASCAVEGQTDQYEPYKKVLKAWVNKNYPDRASMTTNSGAYLLEYSEGSGKAPEDTSFVRLHYTKTDLAGEIYSTNVESLCEQLGSVDELGIYDGDFWQLGKGYVSTGLDEVLRMMREGGHAKVALDPSIAKVSLNLYSVFSSVDEEGNVIYDFTIDEVVPSIYDYQIDSLQAYSRRHYNAMPPCEEGFYFKTIVAVEPESEADTLAEDSSLDIRYVGKLLNGMVFDTNIADTAKFYGIYSPDNSYDALTVTYKGDYKQFSQTNSLVDGFSKAVTKMGRKGEEAITFFWSPLGYGENGSDKIPGYSPLFFDIIIVDNETKDDSSEE